MSYTVTFGSAVFILPLILIKFSSIEISVWYLFASLIGFAGLADTGFGPTLVRAVTYFYTGTKNIPKNINEFKLKTESPNYSINKDGIIKLVQTSNLLYLVISFLATLLILIVGYFLVFNLISMAVNKETLWRAFYILTFTIFIKMQTVKWSSFLQGFNNVAIQKQIETIYGIIRILAYFVVLSFGMKILELVIVDLVLTFVIFLTTRFKMKQLFNQKGISKVNIFKYDSEIMSSIYSSTWRLGAISWGSYFTNFGSSWIVSQLPDPKVIASFLITQKLISFSRQLAQVPLYAELPQVFQMMALHQFDKLKIFVSNVIFASLVILTSLLLGMGWFGNIILDGLNVEIRLMPADILFVMAISIILEFHHSAHSQIYMGSNHVPFLFPSLFSGILVLIIGFNIVGTYSILGIVLTQFFVQLSINNWYPVYLDLRLLNWKFSDYVKDVIFNVKISQIYKNYGKYKD